MIGRLVRSADFQRILRTRPVARSERFAVHHLEDGPTATRRSGLSAADAEAAGPVGEGCPLGQWFGLVVPKRHAKRAVTRSLLKRQMRQLFAGVAGVLGGGLWLIRLKAPFDRKLFPSAASDALRLAAHDELAELLSRTPRRGSG